MQQKYVLKMCQPASGVVVSKSYPLFCKKSGLSVSQPSLCYHPLEQHLENKQAIDINALGG